MKKIIKRSLMFFCLSIIAVIGCLILSKWMLNITTENFDNEVRSENFNIYYKSSDESAIPDIQKYLEDNYQRITTNLKHKPDKSVKVKIYPDLETFHRTVKSAKSLFWWKVDDIPEWVVGTAGDSIKIVSPLNTGNSGKTYSEILQVVVHEFTHIVAFEIDSKAQSNVLSEGIAMYEAKQSRQISPEFLPNSIEEMFSWNNSNEPEKMYMYGGSFVGFIIENYGYDKFIEIYKKDYKNNGFDSDIREIYNKWILKVRNDLRS